MFQRLAKSIIGIAALFVLALGHPAAAEDGKLVRLAIVNTPQFSGLIDDLLIDFRKSSGFEVEIYSGTDVYERARAGEADLVVSHYGKAGVERFVLDGFGAWPRLVFSNQVVIAGPKNDPAGIRGLDSASKAFAKIAAAKAPFVPNALPGIDYLNDVLWNLAGKPDKTGWWDQSGEMKGKAMGRAEAIGGYVIWGALPFLRYKEKHGSELEIMVATDPLLHRVMAAIVVNPDKVPGVNQKGAEALQAYLLSAATQARIAAFRSPGSADQLWWPAARNNATEGLDD